MKIEAKVYLSSEQEGKIKAKARITLDEVFVVKRIKVIEGKNGLFIAMPSTSYKNDQGEIEHRDICFPVTKEFNERLQEVVLQEYENELVRTTENDTAE